MPFGLQIEFEDMIEIIKYYFGAFVFICKGPSRAFDSAALTEIK